MALPFFGCDCGWSSKFTFLAAQNSHMVCTHNVQPTEVIEKVVNVGLHVILAATSTFFLTLPTPRFRYSVSIQVEGYQPLVMVAHDNFLQLGLEFLVFLQAEF